MHADDVVARLHDLLVEGIDQLLVVHAPGMARQILVGVVADRVALPRIGLERCDALVDLVHPAVVARREDGVRQQAPGAGRRVHLGARIGLHLVGQEPVARILRRRAAEQRHLGVAVEEDLLEPVGILEIVQGLRLAHELGIPARLADCLAAAHEAFEPRVVAQEVRVHVHDELVLQPIGTRLGEIDALGLGRRGAVERTVDLVHGDEGGRHAGRGLEEAPARQAVLAAVLVGQRVHARLDLLLPLGLRHRHELVARHDLRRHRSRVVAQSGRGKACTFFVAQHAHGHPPGASSAEARLHTTSSPVLRGRVGRGRAPVQMRAHFRSS